MQPAICAEGIIEDRLVSGVLGRDMELRVIVPPGYDVTRGAPYPVLIFLHPWGLSPRYITDKLRMHDHLWNGVRAGSLPPMVVVLPEGGKSFFLNAADPPGHDWTAVVSANSDFFDQALAQYGRYGDYLWQDVLPYVESRYVVRSDGAGRAIGGISMGGAAAAVHAFRSPDAFTAVGIHSPALFPGPPQNPGPPWIFGVDQEQFAERNPADCARKLAPDTPLRIYLDTGDEDPMRDEVRALHATLTQRGLRHTYHMRPGAHNKTYWEPHMAEYLAFYGQSWHPQT